MKVNHSKNYIILGLLGACILFILLWLNKDTHQMELGVLQGLNGIFQDRITRDSILIQQYRQENEEYLAMSFVYEEIIKDKQKEIDKMIRRTRLLSDSIRKLSDTTIVELLIAEVGYIPGEDDTSYLVPMPVIREATVIVIESKQNKEIIHELQGLVVTQEDNIEILHLVINGKDKEIEALADIIKNKDLRIGNDEEILAIKDKQIKRLKLRGTLTAIGMGAVIVLLIIK